MLLSAEIFRTVAALLEPHLKAARSSPAGTVVEATMQGEFHGLGKNISATLLRARGFEEHDLGGNVERGLLVEKVTAFRPYFVGVSAPLTMTFPSMKQAADMLRDAGARDELRTDKLELLTEPPYPPPRGAGRTALSCTGPPRQPRWNAPQVDGEL